MWKKIALRTRLFSILTVIVLISLFGAFIMIWYTFRMEALLSDIINKNMAGYELAETLETSLASQKGLLSYYFMDKDPDWLKQLGEYRQLFKQQLNQARKRAENPRIAAILEQLEKEYTRYTTIKDQVVDYYKDGLVKEGEALHKQVRGDFFIILELCEQYKKFHKDQIIEAREIAQKQAENLRYTAAVAAVASFLLSLCLIMFLFNQILGPIHRLATKAGGMAEGEGGKNEITSLHKSVQGLLEDVDSTRQALEKSREHLQQTEKMALVGKLAAGMAHSIRNPFTSVKMRLFSLSRALELTETQKDDLNVISEEIRHIDTIVQNFLEFSRPPRLQIQEVSPSTVVDQALQLLVHRLNSYAVRISLHREAQLPMIHIDPEQLKEVLVNIIVNACEAMDRGGKIVIYEKVDRISGLGDVAVIRLTDNGPGIPIEVQDKIFQPFFTTKEDGTGLGLSIATRIIEEHRGRLEVESFEGQGTTFNIFLPIREVGT